MAEYRIVEKKDNKGESCWVLKEKGKKKVLGTVVNINGNEKKGRPQDSTFFQNCYIKVNNDCKYSKKSLNIKMFSTENGKVVENLKPGQGITFNVKKPEEDKLNAGKTEKIAKGAVAVKEKYEKICNEYKTVIDKIDEIVNNDKNRYVGVGNVSDCKKYFESGGNTVMLPSNVDSMDEAVFTAKISKFCNNVVVEVMYFFDGSKGNSAFMDKVKLPEKNKFTLEEMEEILSAIESCDIEKKSEEFQRMWENCCQNKDYCIKLLDGVNEIVKIKGYPPKFKEPKESIEAITRKLILYYGELCKAVFGIGLSNQIELSSRSYDGNMEFLEEWSKPLEGLKERLEKGNWGAAKENCKKCKEQSSKLLKFLNKVRKKMSDKKVNALPKKLTEEELFKDGMLKAPGKLVSYYNALYKASTGSEPGSELSTSNKFELSEYDSTKGNIALLEQCSKDLEDFDEYLEKSSDLEEAKECSNGVITQMNQEAKSAFEWILENIKAIPMFKNIQSPNLDGDLTSEEYTKSSIEKLKIYFKEVHTALSNENIKLSKEFEDAIKEVESIEISSKDVDDKMVKDVESFNKKLVYIAENLPKFLKDRPKKAPAKKLTEKNSIKQVKAVQVLPDKNGNFSDSEAQLANSQKNSSKASDIRGPEWDDFKKKLDKSQLKDVDLFIKRFKSLVSRIADNAVAEGLKTEIRGIMDKINLVGISGLESGVIAVQKQILQRYEGEKCDKFDTRFQKDLTALNKAMENFSKAFDEKNKNNKKQYWENIKTILNDQLNTLERLSMRATQTDNTEEVKSEEEKLKERGFIKRTAGKVAKFVEDTWDSITKKPVKLTLDNTIVNNFKDMAEGIKNLGSGDKRLQQLFKDKFSNIKNTYRSWYDYVYDIVCDMDKCIKSVNKNVSVQVFEVEQEAVKISLMYVFVRSMLHCDLKNVNSIREGIKQFVLAIDKDIISKKDVSVVEGNDNTSKGVMQAGTKTRQLCKDVKSNMNEVLERKKSLRDVLKKEECKKILDYLPASYKNKLKQKIVK